MYRKKMFLWIMILSLFFTLIPAASAAVIDVLTYDESVVGVKSNVNGSINFNFATGGGYATVRNSLLNTSNFGSGGIIPHSVNILAPVPVLTGTALSNADVVVLSAYSNLSDAEKTALSVFMEGGGGVLIFNNYAATNLDSMLGATAGPYTTGDTTGTITDSASPIINGPFGVVSGNILAGWSGSFSDAGAEGSEVIANPVGSLGVTFDTGYGRGVVFTDEELFLNSPSVDGIAWAALRDNTELLFLNSFAYAASGHGPGVIPEPGTFLLMGAGLLGFFFRRKP
ncbi:MAG: PEP-CTERM sorting domain-containing protein [Candidatus Omnitrophica bacterium]|nr:PEP-CTERM sorting domain-containing protein [Candidatus Omnitrophota bacterium]